MEFCNKCDNIYYIEIIDGILSYKCKKCKNVVILDEINNKPYLIKTDIQKKKSSYEYIINEYTKYDNTLPRIKHIKCPRCSTKPSKQEPKQELKQESKQELKQEPKQELKQELKQEPKQESKQEPKQESKQEPKQEPKQELKQEPKQELKQEPNQFDDDDSFDNDGSDENVSMEGGGSSHDGEENEVIYIRYDDINLKYIYLCCKCNYSWKL